jgi:hypothetical protein
METDSNALIEELLVITERASDITKKFKALTTDQLNFRTSPNKWSILQCIEHLNLYGDFYLPEIEKQILANKGLSKSSQFKSGMIGNYFANLMKVRNGKIKKMKAPKDKTPSNSELTITTIERFLKQQELLKSLLVQSRSVDLTKTKVPISLAKFIRLRLGDTFRFFIYHIERHISQAESIRTNRQH